MEAVGGGSELKGSERWQGKKEKKERGEERNDALSRTTQTIRAVRRRPRISVGIIRCAYKPSPRRGRGWRSVDPRPGADEEGLRS